MAGYTYYYMFSIIAVIVIVVYIINILSFRRRGKTIAGQKYQKNTTEYNKMINLSGPRNLVILIILSIIFITNLVLSFRSMASLNTPSSSFGLVAIPIIVVALFVIIFLITPRLFGGSGKRK